MSASIYFLHKGDFIPRYAGRTIQRPSNRLNGHRSASPEHGCKNKVRDDSLEIFVVRDGIAGDGRPEEQEYMGLLLAAGYSLWNSNHNSNGGLPGWRHTEETKATMRATRTGKKRPPRSDAHKANLSASLKGRGTTDATRAKLSAAATGRIPTPEHRAKMSASASNRARNENGTWS